MAIKSPRHSSHHILAKSRGGSNNKHNMTEIKHTTHQAIHTLFGTDIMPDKIKNLIGLEYTALRTDVVARLLTVLEEIGDKKEDRYNPECIQK